MQVKNFSVYKDVPVQVKVTKDRFYDYKQMATLSADTTIHVALNAYAGLNAEFLSGEKVSTVTVSAGELPDYGEFAGTSGILQPCGQTFFAENGNKYKGLLAAELTDSGAETLYNLFYKEGDVILDTAESREGWIWVGSLTVPQHTVQPIYQMNYTEKGTLAYELTFVSGFAANKYLVSNKAMPNNSYFAYGLRFITRVAGVASIYDTQNILWDESANNHGFGISGSAWRIWNGAAHTGGTVTEGGAYWVMLVQDAHDGSKLYYLVDDGTYTEETLPEDLNAWVLAVSVEGKVFDTTGAPLRIGTGYATPTEYWRGKIDLLHTHVDLGVKSMDANTLEPHIEWQEYWRPLSLEG